MSDQTPRIRLEWERANDLLQNSQHILLLTHQRPDGDAIGSLCALGAALQAQGKQVRMVVDEGINDYLSFVPFSETVLSAVDSAFQPDLIISCDSSSLDRLGEAGAAVWDLPVPKLVLDHHATNTFFGDVYILHQDYVSTTEAVLHLLDFMGWALTHPIAKALTVGFMTDTLCFRVGPVTATTLQQVARLMALGVDLREVNENMLGRGHEGELELLGVALRRLKIEQNVGYSYLAQRDFKRLGRDSQHRPEIATELLRDPRVYIAAFFYETEDKVLRLSLRAVAGFDIGAIALQLGGGGHKLAAGVSFPPKTTLAKALGQVIPLLLAEAKRGQPLYPR